MDHTARRRVAEVLRQVAQELGHSGQDLAASSKKKVEAIDLRGMKGVEAFVTLIFSVGQKYNDDRLYGLDLVEYVNLRSDLQDIFRERRSDASLINDFLDREAAKERTYADDEPEPWDANSVIDMIIGSPEKFVIEAEGSSQVVSYYNNDHYGEFSLGVPAIMEDSDFRKVKVKNAAQTLLSSMTEEDKKAVTATLKHRNKRNNFQVTWPWKGNEMEAHYEIQVSGELGINWAAVAQAIKLAGGEIQISE